MNNEPAFPLQSIGPDFAPGWAGMTLRDYFAAKAMQGWLASFPEHVEASTAEKSCHVTARLAYTIADAMMKARGES